MKTISKAFVFLFVSMLVPTLVFADGPPRHLQGTFHDNLISLNWARPESPASPSFYNIYRNSGEHFPSKIATTHDTAYDDNTVVLHTIYHYAVTAVYRDTAESFPSNIIEVSTGADSTGDTSHVHITFTSEPARTATINTLYQYDANVTTDPAGVKVCFHLDNAPDGMTINDSTGLVQWTPGSPGSFGVSIEARVCDGSEGEAEQEYQLNVFSGPPGGVTGTVLNDSGTALSGVIIKLFGVSQGDFVLRTHTDNAGHYSFTMVNPATYFVRARPEDELYAPQWYNGVSRIENATPVVVPENTTVTVNFTLHRRDSSHVRFTLSGTVMDPGSHPIHGAKVFAVRVDRDTTSGGEFDDHHDGEGDHGDQDGVETDSAGQYVLRLREGTYIVGAMAEGFLPQFWNHKTNPLEADRIHLTGNSTGIDFNLSGRPTGTGVIGGTIRKASDRTGLKSHVLGFLRDGTGHFTGFVAFARSDSSGSYQLNHLPNGSYVVLAKSEDDFVPTFYNSSGGTPSLDSATAVASSGGVVSGIDIYVLPDTTEGLNSVVGVVSSPSPVGGSAPGSSTPIAGAIVTLFNQNGATVGSAISQADGSYLVPGMAPGDYNILFQKPGKTSANAGAYLDYMNGTPTTTTVNAMLSDAGGGSGQVMNIQPQWNLVSLPVTVADAHRNAVFPSATSAAFRYDGSSYVLSDMLDYSSGYWLRFSAAQVFSISGSQRTSQTVTLSPGWNLVGSISTSVGTSAVTTNPAGILSTHFFTYTRGYTTATSIDPGKGYWVKASAGGSLTLNAGGASPKASANSALALSALNSLTIKDAAGNSQTLYFGGQTPTIDANAYQLPPLPPAEAFDIRFSGQGLVQFHPVSVQHGAEYLITLQSAAAPLTVSWSIHSGNAVYSLKDRSGAVSVRMSGNGSIRIASSPGQLVLSAQPGQLPKEFALHQNYPNPFNPSTTIGFDLPVSADVTLKVYNILGQEVASLLTAQHLDAGVQSIQFDASRLASGLYFYRLHAGNYVSVKKMVLLK
ncbi:MAG: T9SS type A sorting domain-containing protein [Ignavibacteria bacterium]|nr:MAG: T9SS type A sorting domain-containing protein [Ignavibacteria bacterium]